VTPFFPPIGKRGLLNEWQEERVFGTFHLPEIGNLTGKVKRLDVKAIEKKGYLGHFTYLR
jgi:hypothetical protein